MLLHDFGPFPAWERAELFQGSYRKAIPVLLFELPPPPVNEDPFDEVPPEERIVQAAVLLDGKQRKTFHERPGEDPHPLLHGHAGVSVNLHRGHSGTGRSALEDESAQILGGERLQTFVRPGEHPVRVVDAGPDGDQTGVLRIPEEAHRLAGYGEAVFHLRADGDPLEPAAKGVGDVTVVLMAAVVTDILPQQAGADTDPDLLYRRFLPILGFMRFFRPLRCLRMKQTRPDRPSPSRAGRGLFGQIPERIASLRSAPRWPSYGKQAFL